MATNVIDGKKDTEETNLRPITLNKTTNITKIKGWRNKKFNLEIVDKVDASRGSVSSISAQDDDGQLDNNFTQIVRLTDIGISGKHRNPELLDCLVQKIGDPNDIAFGDVSISSKTNETMNLSAGDAACFDGFPMNRVSEVKKKLNTVSSNLPEAMKNASFLKSAFISESLDNFLSGVMNVNNTREDTSSLNVVKLSSTKTKVAQPVVKPEDREPKPVCVKVVDEFGKKPRTLAEKRRILESVGYPHKMLKIDDEVVAPDSLAKHFSSYLNDDDNFRRKEENDVSKRVLRSSISSGDVSSTDIKQVPRNDDNPKQSVTMDHLQSKKQVKGKSLVKSLFKLRREVQRENSRIKKKIKQKFKEKLKNLVKKSKIDKLLSERVYIKPLKKRIFIDFMPLLKEHEIVTKDDIEFTKSVRMVMFLGIGRCLYEEQAENLDLLRDDRCVVSENYANFATSTVLDRKCPKKIVRMLIPVVSTKLLTFMKRYNLIKERYNEFLVNKFNIDVSSSLSAQSRSQVSAQNVNNFQNETSKQNDENSDVELSNPVNSVSQSNNDKQTGNLGSHKKSKCSVTKEVAVDQNKLTESTGISFVNNEITNDQIAEASSCNSSSNTSPNCNMKFKKRVIKNGRIFHEDKRITKLNYELRRLNHAFVEIEGESDANILNSSNDKDMKKLLPDDIIPNKLAKVESEFHQTIMKSKGDFVFVSSFGERARRNRKLPKKLEDTIMLSESAITSKELCSFEDSILSTIKESTRGERNLKSGIVHSECSDKSSQSELDSLKLSEKSFETPKGGEEKAGRNLRSSIVPLESSDKSFQIEPDSLKLSEKSSEIPKGDEEKVRRNLRSNIVQLESSDKSFRSEADSLKPSENIFKAREKKCNEVVQKEICPNNNSTNRTSTEQNFEACEDKRSSDVIGTELVIVQTAQSILKKNVLVDGANDINKSNSKSFSTYEENVERNNVNKLESKSGGLNPVVLLKRIICRGSMRVLCMDHVKYDCSCLSDKASHGVRNVAVKRTNPNYSYKLDFVSSYKDFIKLGYSNNMGKIEFDPKYNKETDVIPMVEQKSESQGNNGMIPRIENIMSLKPEDFFKDDCTNISDAEGSAAAQTAGYISQNEERVLQVEPRVQLSGLLEDSKTLNKRVIKSYVHTNFRFFSVLLNYPFSYLKFYIGSEWKSHFKKELLVNSLYSDSNLYILIPYNFICNLVNEAVDKKQCVFQSLMNSNYNPSNFNNLPFGIYAVCKNMVIFGPYAVSEPHRLQAFNFCNERLEVQLESSQAKQIPFVNPEYQKEFQAIDFIFGYWWYVVNNKATKYQAAYSAMVANRISRPVMDASIVVPVRVPLKKDVRRLEDSNRESINGVLHCDNQNSSNVKVDKSENEGSSSELENDKLASKNNSNNIVKIYRLNFKGRGEENTITTSKTINKEDPFSCNSKKYEMYLDNLKNRFYRLANIDSSVPGNSKTSPLISVKNSQVMSVVYPQEKNTEIITDNGVTLGHSKEQGLIQDLGGNQADKDSKTLSVRPNGLKNPEPLCKLKQIGNTSYYCLKSNRKHIFKISNRNTKIADKNTFVLYNKNVGQSSGSSVNIDSATHDVPNAINDDSNHSNNTEFSNPSKSSLSRQLQETVESENCFDFITAESIVDKQKSLDREDLTETDVQRKSDLILPKKQISEQVSGHGGENNTHPEVTLKDLNSVSDLQKGSVLPISSNTNDSISAKSNDLQTKEVSSGANVTKFSLQKYRKEMKNSHGFIPITSDLLRKNISGLSKSNVKVIEPTNDKVIKSSRILSSLLKTNPNPAKTADKCLQSDVCESGSDYIPSAQNTSSNDTKSQSTEIATNNEDILVGFSKSIESIERMKGSGINSAKGVLLKVKFKDESQLVKLNAKTSSDTAELIPLSKEINKNSVDRCNSQSEPTSNSVTTNFNDNNFGFSILKSVSDIPRKRIVNRYDSPHCSDEVLLINDNDEQENSSATKYCDSINIDDSVEMNSVINDETGLRIVNEENNPLAFLTSKFDDTSSLSLSSNDLPIDATITPLPPEELDVQFVCDPKNPTSSPPLLKRTMMKFVREAKSVSKQTSNTDQDTVVGEELKLVSNLDSLPNFLESYGIHFTDDDI